MKYSRIARETEKNNTNNNINSSRFTCEVFRGVRRHIESVLHYTQVRFQLQLGQTITITTTTTTPFQSPKVDIISHSMGVTIARAAIIGGTVSIFFLNMANLLLWIAAQLLGRCLSLGTFARVEGKKYCIHYFFGQKNHKKITQKSCISDNDLIVRS